MFFVMQLIILRKLQYICTYILPTPYVSGLFTAYLCRSIAGTRVRCTEYTLYVVRRLIAYNHVRTQGNYLCTAQYRVHT